MADNQEKIGEIIAQTNNEKGIKIFDRAEFNRNAAANSDLNIPIDFKPSQVNTSEITGTNSREGIKILDRSEFYRKAAANGDLTSGFIPSPEVGNVKTFKAKSHVENLTSRS